MTDSPFKSYWAYYGGFRAMLTSWYFWTAFALTAVTFNWWLVNNWWDNVIAIVPSILGFSLGGYLMLLAVGSERFMELLARSGRNATTALVGVSSAFVHFIMIQFLALILTLLFIATDQTFWSTKDWKTDECLFCFRGIQSGLAVLLFYYSLTTGIASTLRIFSLANLYVRMTNESPDS